MAERLEQKFELQAPVDLVWAFLTDPYQVVACLPGAAITSKVDDRTYNGTITLKVGLVTAEYKGRATFQRLDAAKRETEVVGMGQDVKGKGSAEMRMVSRLRAVGEKQTEVNVSSEVQITGLFAQMGRGMIEGVANQMLTQFTTQFKRKLDQSRMKYAEIVKAHVEVYAKFYAEKLPELQSVSGIKISADGNNNAASPGDVVKYREAVKRVAGATLYNTARVILKNAAQSEGVPLPGL